jgi:hypothetical protein
MCVIFTIIILTNGPMILLIKKNYELIIEKNET